jgi:hypothetical protein
MKIEERTVYRLSFPEVQNFTFEITATSQAEAQKVLKGHLETIVSLLAESLDDYPSSHGAWQDRADESGK